MSKFHLARLADRVAEQAFFLAGPLAAFAAAREMSATQLAEQLGCQEDTLDRIKLCRSPSSEELVAVVQQIAQRFQINEDVLAEAVRLGQTLLRWQRSSIGGSGTLIAAREKEDFQDPKGNP